MPDDPIVDPVPEPTPTPEPNPFDDPIYQIRVLIGDLDEQDQIFSDNELQWYLDLYNNDIWLVASECCLRLANQYAGLSKTTVVDEVRIDLSNNYQQYLELSKTYKQRSDYFKRKRMKIAPIIFGGSDSKTDFPRNIPFSRRTRMSED